MHILPGYIPALTSRSLCPGHAQIFKVSPIWHREKRCFSVRSGQIHVCEFCEFCFMPIGADKARAPSCRMAGDALKWRTRDSSHLRARSLNALNENTHTHAPEQFIALSIWQSAPSSRGLQTHFGNNLKDHTWGILCIKCSIKERRKGKCSMSSMIAFRTHACCAGALYK